MKGFQAGEKENPEARIVPRYFKKTMITLKEKGNFPKTLIKVFSKNVNPNGKLSELSLTEDEVQEILQEDYDQTIKKLFKNGKIPSPCCENGTLRIFGHYVRGLEIPYGLVKIRITRVICSGCGKIHAILMDYMIYTSMTSLTTAEFFRHIASLLGLEPTYRKSDNLAMIKENIESLASSSKKTPVIIIDEANELDTQCINDLKIMMNFNMDSQNKAVLVLCGLPDINKRLNIRLLEPVRQRIVTNFKMDGLSKEESAQYISHSLRGAGCMQQNLFTADAVEAITGIADGKPRIINNICAKALIMGGLRKLQQINSEVIRLAHDDMVLE